MQQSKMMTSFHFFEDVRDENNNLVYEYKWGSFKMPSKITNIDYDDKNPNIPVKISWKIPDCDMVIPSKGFIIITADDVTSVAGRNNITFEYSTPKLNLAEYDKKYFVGKLDIENPDELKKAWMSLPEEITLSTTTIKIICKKMILDPAFTFVTGDVYLYKPVEIYIST